MSPPHLQNEWKLLRNCWPGVRGETLPLYLFLELYLRYKIEIFTSELTWLLTLNGAVVSSFTFTDTLKNQFLITKIHNGHVTKLVATQSSSSVRNKPINIYMFKFNNRNTRTRCEICSKLTIKTPDGVFIINFEHISRLVLVFLL